MSTLHDTYMLHCSHAGLNPDWLSYIVEFESRKGYICLKTTCSITFDNTGKIEIGL